MDIQDNSGVASSFYVREDGVPELNGVDSAGRDSVIRDFRSGNLGDGTTTMRLTPVAVTDVCENRRVADAGSGHSICGCRRKLCPKCGPLTPDALKGLSEPLPLLHTRHRPAG